MKNWHTTLGGTVAVLVYLGWKLHSHVEISFGDIVACLGALGVSGLARDASDHEPAESSDTKSDAAAASKP